MTERVIVSSERERELFGAQLIREGPIFAKAAVKHYIEHYKEKFDLHEIEFHKAEIFTCRDLYYIKLYFSTWSKEEDGLLEANHEPIIQIVFDVDCDFVLLKDNNYNLLNSEGSFKEYLWTKTFKDCRNIDEIDLDYWENIDYWEDVDEME